MAQRVRLGIVAALVLLLLPLGYVTYVAYQTPDFFVREVPVWGWVHWGEWDYTVFVKPNSVYESRELGPGLTYYENLVEGIEARFSYNLVTDAAARIEGSYEVWEELKVRDDMSERKLLISRVPFVVEQGAAYAVDFTLPVDRAAYRNRIAQVASETGISSGGSPAVTFTAYVESSVTNGADSTRKVRKVMEPTLIIPLNGGETFTITGDRSLNENGVIRRDETVLRPNVRVRRLYSVIAMGVAAILPGVFFLATANRPPQDDAATREANRLRRKHRKLIAHASPEEGSELPGEQRLPLAAMQDLVRVSGELLKPIVYAAPRATRAEHVFFVIDGATRYEYRVRATGLGGLYNGSTRILVTSRGGD